tara:strand:- start:17091 stop:19046 length:1956 start_codon:yes stop_codon:yes gene_type:complete
MATTVDTLLVRIEADMSDLKKQLKRVERDVNKSTGSIAAAFKRMGPAIGAVAGALVVRQLGRMGMAAINLAGDVEEMQAKSSVVFGTFRDQVVSDLDEFGNAVGRSTHKLEEMASSVQDTFVPMGFARGEAAKLSVALTKLAVDTASFNNANDVETMRAFQSAIVGNHETVRRFGVVITEATLKQELFRMGITKNIKEVTNAEKVQARLNLITAGLQDAQGDAARTADSFTNQTKALKDEFFDLSVEIGTQLIPVALELVEILREGIKIARSFGIAIGFLNEFTDDLTGKKAEIAAIKVEIAALQAVIDETEGSLGGAHRRDLAQRQMAQAQGRLEELQNEVEILKLKEDVLKALAQVENPTGGKTIGQDVREELQKNALLREQVRMQLQLNKAVESGNEAAILRAKTRIAEFPALKRSAGFVESLTNKEEKLMLATEKFTGIEDGVIVVSGQLGLELEKLGEQYDKLTEEIDEINPMFDAQLAAVHSMAQGMSEAFTDMFMSGKFNLESLKDVFRSFVRTMIAKAIELFVVNRILSMLFPSAFTQVGMAFMPKLASGGAVNGRQAYVVGERGPEIFVPHSAGTIMNSNNTRSAMSGNGGATVVQNINVTTGIQQTVRNEIRSLMPEIAANAKNAVTDSKRRGGNFGRAFA